MSLCKTPEDPEFLCPFLNLERWILCNWCMAPSVVWIYGHMTFTRLACTCPWTFCHHLFVPRRRTPTFCIWSRSWRASKWCWTSKTNSYTSRKRSWWRSTNWWETEADEHDCWRSRRAATDRKNTWITQLFFSFQKEKNVKLDEIFKKVQQENEDLKARMDRHAALSR